MFRYKSYEIFYDTGYSLLITVTNRWVLVAGYWLLNLGLQSPMIKSNWAFSDLICRQTQELFHFGYLDRFRILGN